MSAALDGREAPQLIFENSGPTPLYLGYGAATFADEGDILLIGRRAQGRFEVALLRMDDGPNTEPKVLLTGAADPQISPDGKWLVYEADTSGRVEIYVRRWLGNGELGPETPVSTVGGQAPIWYREKEGGPWEIWYINQGQAYGVRMENASAATLSRPRLIADRNEQIMEVHAAPDGRVLTLFRGEDEKDPGRLNVILNWRSELSERLQ